MQLKSNTLIGIIILILFSAINISFSFNYGRYKETTTQEITAKTQKLIANNPKDIQHIRIEALKILIKLQEYPVAMSKDTNNTINVFFSKTPMDDKYRDIYTHEMKYIDKGTTFKLVFQTVLVEPLKKEIKLNEYAEVYAIYGTYNTTTKTHTLLINEFSGPVVFLKGKALNDYVIKKIDEIEQNPLSEISKKAYKDVVEFTFESEDVVIEIKSDLFNWLKEKSKYDKIIFGAYIAGNIRQQLKNNIKRDHPLHGMKFMFKVYNKIQAQDSNYRSPSIDNLINIYNKGKLKHYIKNKLK